MDTFHAVIINVIILNSIINHTMTAMINIWFFLFLVFTYLLSLIFSIFYYWNHHYYFYILLMIILICLDILKSISFSPSSSLYFLNTAFYALFSPLEFFFYSRDHNENRVITVCLTLPMPHLYYKIRVQILYQRSYYYFISCKC